MKTIMISVKPEYADLEMNGKKTIDVRKFYIEPPFKVVNYVTKEKSKYTKEEIYANVNYDWADYYKLKGKVAFEYVVNKVDKYFYSPNCYNENEKMYYIRCGELEQTCLTYDELLAYGKSKTLYGFHISDLKIYDKPKELWEFDRLCKENAVCERCEGWAVVDGGYECSPVYDCIYDCRKPITRSPSNFIHIIKV